MEATFKHLSKLGLALLIAASAMSCASKSDGGSDDGGSPSVVDPDTNNPDGGGTDATDDFFADEGGGSAVFVLDGGTSTTNLNSAQKALLTKFVGTHPLNKPRNTRIMIDTSDVSDNGSGRWGGNVKIGYYDNGQVYGKDNAGFTTENPSGSEKVRVSYKNVYTGNSHAEFNRWFLPSGGSQQIFHGFFQDSLGAIVIVVDNSQTVDLGDGLGTQELSGKVYFKNFKTAPAAQFMDVNGDGEVDGEMCWFLFDPSPYACGTFKVSDATVGSKVVTTSAVYPKAADGYTLLGTFSGLKRNKAFHQ